MQCCIWIAVMRLQSFLSVFQIPFDSRRHKAVPYAVLRFNLVDWNMFL